jgi:hypothetical protein
MIRRRRILSPRLSSVVEISSVPVRGSAVDYAAVMATMLRTQNITPGWKSVCFRRNLSCLGKRLPRAAGWVNGIIYFDGKTWKLMDPLRVSRQKQRQLMKFMERKQLQYQICHCGGRLCESSKGLLPPLNIHFCAQLS